MKHIQLWYACTVLVLCRLNIGESLELILAPRLHSVSNGTTYFCVLIPADTSGGWVGINTVSINSSVACLLKLIARTFLLRAMCSNRVSLTLEQQVDVLEKLVRDNRVEVNFTLETNGMDNGASNDSHTLDTDVTVDSIVHWQWHCIKQAANAIIMHHAWRLQAPAECWLTCTHAHTTSLYLHTHTTLLIYLFIKCSGYDNYNTIIVTILYCHLMCVNISIYCNWMLRMNVLLWLQYFFFFFNF